MNRTILVAVGLCIVAVLIWHPVTPAPLIVDQSTPAPRRSKPPRPLASASDEPVVYVAGAVLRPGLYRLSRGARADDAVRRAGGFRSDADAAGINLAARVADGDEVFAPALGEPTPRPIHRHPAHAKSKKTTTAVVDVNVASAEELARVPGLGKTIAARIVDVRQRDGAYTSLDQLLDVAGMTPARLDRAQAYLRI